MNREAIWIPIESQELPVDLVTFHLESGSINSTVRQQQIKEIISQGPKGPSIMCGDTNFISPEEQFDPQFIDYSPKEPSYDYRINKRILGPWISHLDRVFLKETSPKGLSIKFSTMIRNDDISDHFGILFSLEFPRD
jgi:endonuclease/exonuclease/phosphatase family metal-dependent hydrolase